MAHPSRGEEVTVIGAIGDREHVARLELEGSPGVEKVVPILKPYKLASHALRGGAHSVLEIGGRKIGGEHFALIAGPCTVESRDQTLTTADVVSAAGATMFRGGAYKPRTSPYAFLGLGQEGLRLLAEAKERTGLPIVTELMDTRDIDAVAEVADGADHGQLVAARRVRLRADGLDPVDHRLDLGLGGRRLHHDHHVVQDLLSSIRRDRLRGSCGARSEAARTAKGADRAPR